MALAIWMQAARPKTLVASFSPVIIGTACALRAGSFDFLTFLFTLLTALGIQIGTNFANDYFDFMKGADTKNRKGPVRVTQAGLVKPETMKLAVFLAFALTALSSGYLILQGGWPIALLASLSILLGFAYTAGPLPLAYLGLGDLFVLLFFGPIATAGTAFLQTHTLSTTALLAGIGPGLISTAILTVNNLRDIDEDRLAGKRTLVVRLGKKFGQWEYCAAIVLAAILPCLWGSYLQLLMLAPALPLLSAAFKTEGAAWNPILGKTAQLLWIYTILQLL
jgi:1,4-dihydroxy-2-naphthoate octaprenyltransferase